MVKYDTILLVFADTSVKKSTFNLVISLPLYLAKEHFVQFY